MNSILFVDDDSEVISSTKRLLYIQHKEWQIQFANSAALAIEKLNNSPVNVIVSDIRMPGMDGIEFLTIVKEKWPQTIRIVLSGHSDRDSSLQASGLVHQFLAKPCPIEAIISTIEKALETTEVVQDPQLRILLGQLKNIPSQPQAYVKIVEELKNPEVSSSSVGKIISQDASMSAKILQLVNSAFFSIPQTISDPAQAVVLLGVETIRDLVLVIGVFSQFDQAKLERFALNNLWHHSQRTSGLAKRIVIDANGDKKQINHSLVAGLVHDIGKLVIAENLPDIYEKVIQTCTEQQRPFQEVEIELLTTSHANIGAYLLGLWGLPDPIVQAVHYHHQPAARPGNQDIVGIAVHIANVIDYDVHPTSDIKWPGPVLDESCVEKFGLSGFLVRWSESMKEL
jgi:HD-like signal output (HDOD) protein/CheY-like chemotaxis protein